MREAAPNKLVKSAAVTDQLLREAYSQLSHNTSSQPYFQEPWCSDRAKASEEIEVGCVEVW